MPGRPWKVERSVVVVHCPLSSSVITQWSSGRHWTWAGWLEKRKAPVLMREKPRPPLNVPPAVVDLLRTLLKLRSEQAGVAPRLVASAEDLDRLASGKHDGIQALNGWRAEIFGNDALKLIDGKLALGLDRDRVRLIAV